VGYPIVRLRAAHGGVVGYLRRLELALVRVLTDLGVGAFLREGLTGVWTERGKIASIGVRLSAAVTQHGFALNVDPDLSYFDGIVPCGIEGCAMSSVALELGRPATVEPLLRAVTGAVADALEMPAGDDADGRLQRLARHELDLDDAALAQPLDTWPAAAGTELPTRVPSGPWAV
jgi:lipoyl(octanoyl) transferase